MYINSQIFLSPLKVRIMDAVNLKDEETVVKLVEESDPKYFNEIISVLLAGSSVYVKMPIAGMKILHRLTSMTPLSAEILSGIFLTKEHLGEEVWATSVIEKLPDSDLAEFLIHLASINQHLALAAIVIRLSHGHPALTQSLLDMCYKSDSWAMGAIYQIEEKGIHPSTDQSNLHWSSRVSQEHDFTNMRLLSRLFGYFYGLIGNDCLTIARSAPVLMHEHHYNFFLAYGICSCNEKIFPPNLSKLIKIDDGTICISNGVPEDIISKISLFASKVHIAVVSEEYPEYSLAGRHIQALDVPSEYFIESKL